MNDFKLIREIGKVQHDQVKLSELILETDFTGMERAMRFVIRAFDITNENVKKHRDAAKKLIEIDMSELGGVPVFRQAFLVDRLEEITNE